MYDIITIGSATVDLFLDTGSKLFHKIRENLCEVPFGRKVLVDDVHMYTGGGATNTGVAFSRMGFKTAFIGRVGNDSYSDILLKEMKKEKIDKSLITIDSKHPTAFSIVLDAKGHDRTILAYKGCCDCLRFKDINKNKLKTKWLYATSLMGESFNTLEKVILHVKNGNTKVMFNPSSYLAKKGKKFLKKILDNTDILVFNKEEAELLLNKKKPGSIEFLLKECFKLIQGIVIITDGSKGVHAYDGEKIYSIKPHKVKLVETTGAGDAFGAGFLSGYIKKNSIEYGLKSGLVNAESVISYHGAKNNLLTWKETVSVINKKSIKIKIY